MDTKSIWDAQEEIITVKIDSAYLEAELVVPETAEGIVMFAHSGGSGRYSTRNRYLSHILRQAGLATIAINLLTKEEEAINLRTKHYQCDTKHLAMRLIKATNWLAENPNTSKLKVGFFGYGTGSGAALLAAAEHPIAVGAIVSYSGQTDLVCEVLSCVKTPTLLIVGSNDLPVIAMNEDALALISAPNKQLEIILGATHNFNEPGALQEVGRLASQWFKHHLTTDQQRDLHVHAMSLV
ncbi:dienelactone hydrolase family protein [Chlorogloeopsis sp. ULAP01]|uniref:dienelactone hydrolase family protein n=1 Tax=Chlorogloeopsis sp. ULAP01 TaxID=3056483 RepID=UPI0025AAF3FB|nr:dienelactone hydrolase family protein [Chlorogloeopsis sp. ULAP01]MDM9381351.1 dienelactone hydrolase family protein [Chlorogloeopsis sp. ULAP01]